MSSDLLVDSVAEAVRSADGVADLHGGTLGEVGTYLPGRRVLGLRLTDDVCEIHVAVERGRPVREVAALVRETVRPLVPGHRIDIVIEDVVG